MLLVLLSQDVWLWLYFIHCLVSGVCHGLGLGFSHIVELWFGVSRVLVCPWDNVTSCIVPECSITATGGGERGRGRGEGGGRRETKDIVSVHSTGYISHSEMVPKTRLIATCQN